MKYYVLALLFLLLAWYVVQEDNEIPIEMEIKNVAANLIKNVATGEVSYLRKNHLNKSALSQNLSIYFFLEFWSYQYYVTL